MSQPSLLILDEATSALDMRTEADTLNSIATLGYAPTRVVVAHRLSSVTNADLVFVVNDGRIESQGLFKDLATSSPTLVALMKSSRHGDPGPKT
jgi:ATP-binding cassette, subfamily B, bacterial